MLDSTNVWLLKMVDLTHVANLTVVTLLTDVIAIRIHKLEVKQLFPSIRGDKTRQITPLKDWKAHLTHFRILRTRGAPKSQVVLRSQRKTHLMRSQALNNSKKRQQHLQDEQQELARQQHLKIARLDVAARNYRS